jgi:hypothetical protein
MSTTFNARRAGAPSYPRFSGKLSKVTGEGEQIELAFTADSADELAAHLAAAGRAATARLTANNDTIVAAGATFAERQRQAYDAAVTTLRQEMTTMLTRRDEEHEPPPEHEDEEPVGPPAPGDAPAEDEPDADVTARPLHPAADP